MLHHVAYTPIQNALSFAVTYLEERCPGNRPRAHIKGCQQTEAENMHQVWVVDLATW